MNDVFMLSTTDNPFDPFDDFDAWNTFDCDKGHFTASRIARIANIDSEMTQKEVDEEQMRAMDLIFRHDLEDKYIKVWEKQNATGTNA